jgi:hypothetical protein
MRTGRDSAQRLAIARSGRFRAWSLTWTDVQSRLDDKLSPSPAFDTLLALLTSAREAPENLIAGQLKPRFRTAMAGADGTAVQPAGYVRFKVAAPLRIAVTLLDIDPKPGDEWKTAWVEFLHLSNLIGFVPQGRFLTAAGLRDGI